MKGDIKWFIGMLIFAILILVIISYWIIKNWQAASTFFPQATQAVQLEEAIACSHIRCVDGCASPKINSLKNINCKIDFCKPEWTDTGNPDGKICDDNARAHPVTAIVASTPWEEVAKSALKELTADGEPIVFLGISGDNCQSQGSAYVAYIDNQHAPFNKTDSQCRAAGRGSTQYVPYCYSNVIVETGTYYAWTESGGFFPSFNTIACHEQPETSTTTATIGCGDAGGNCRVENCLPDEEQIQGTCPQSRDISRVCCKTTS